jgi:hypothetical protein
VQLAEALPGHFWRKVVDTSGQAGKSAIGSKVALPADCIVAYELCPLDNQIASSTLHRNRKAIA